MDLTDVAQIKHPLTVLNPDNSPLHLSEHTGLFVVDVPWFPPESPTSNSENHPLPSKNQPNPKPSTPLNSENPPSTL